MPCNPNDVSFPVPTVPSGSPIPGFGLPFALPVPATPFPSGFPEDLLDILNKLQLLIPPGAMKPALNPNFGKDVFDGIMKLLDQFFPFLMLYKFFLPVLNLIICIIEVLCALMNPFALISALNRLFTQCIPEFLNLFPTFALIVMIISLLLLLLALIVYLIEQILKFVQSILRNINALVKAFQTANATSVLSIAKKLGSLLCIFQNFFVLLSLFSIIIQVIKDILKLVFAIPPCEGGGPNSTEGCCSATVCPTIVQNQYTNTTGTLQYLNESGIQTSVVIPGGNFNVDIRSESWQLYDPSQTIAQAFINIVDGYDINPSIVPKPVFFPTDSNYSATTSPQQAAYTIDLRMYYNPASWGRSGDPRFIRFKDCIVLFAPTRDLKIYDNSITNENNGVLYLAGGLGYEDDFTRLNGFANDGITPISNQATLNNFIHKRGQFSINPILLPTDGYTFSNMQYTFKPNLAVLLQKNLITLGCEPGIALSRSFINNVAFGDIALKTADLKNVVNGSNFPDPTVAQQCMTTAISALRVNLTTQGVAEFQTTTSICLDKLKNDTLGALSDLINIGVAPCASNFKLSTDTQFTTRPIIVTVNLNENNGLPITTGIPTSVGSVIASQIKPFITFGKINHFSYDGYQAFIAEIESDKPGNGEIMVSFNNNILCTNVLPANGTPSHTLQKLTYNFVYAPYGGTIPVPVTGENDTTGTHPRRDDTDLSGG